MGSLLILEEAHIKQLFMEKSLMLYLAVLLNQCQKSHTSFIANFTALLSGSGVQSVSACKTSFTSNVYRCHFDSCYLGKV